MYTDGCSYDIGKEGCEQLAQWVIMNAYRRQRAYCRKALVAARVQRVCP